MRKAYGLGDDEPLRDALSTEDLRKVVDVESTISALIRLGKEYGEIRDELFARKSVFRGEDEEKGRSLIARLFF